ncbi:MAG TPA: type I-U CRISPR-associated protein Cas7 [Rhodanobacteraceae bacterium]|nr:type I-U CRISPR-associated protein Cas7 [Rhodanobacteraceae bacterium]
MTEQNPRTLTPTEVLKGTSPLVITAELEPVGGLDRFQPAGFPEIGHVIYKAPRADGSEEPVCIVDSPASMANHLESLCMRGAHDYDLTNDLIGMPYLRCVTSTAEDDAGELDESGSECVVTSLTEGHRIASTYFLGGKPLDRDRKVQDNTFDVTLVKEFGIALPGSKKAHPPASQWWNVFSTIFKYDPNALVHGVLFPQWQIKIPRLLTAHLEALGAGRVDRSGVKFDRLGKTNSGQPIFAVDDAVAQRIRATFILDTSLVQSFGRDDKGNSRGLKRGQKEFLIALALWKIQRLVGMPFRYRSGCHLALQKDGLKANGEPAVIDVNIGDAINNADFGEASSRITDIYWPRKELYREGKDEDQSSNGDAVINQDDDSGDDEEEGEE